MTSAKNSALSAWHHW